MQATFPLMDMLASAEPARVAAAVALGVLHGALLLAPPGALAEMNLEIKAVPAKEAPPPACGAQPSPVAAPAPAASGERPSAQRRP